MFFNCLMILLGFAFSFLLFCLADLQMAVIYWLSHGMNLYNSPKFRNKRTLFNLHHSELRRSFNKGCLYGFNLTPNADASFHYTVLNDTITQCFSWVNPLPIYHMRSVFIFAAECLTLSLVLHNQAGIFPAEDSIRGAKGANPSVHPTLALALTTVTAESSHLFLPESREPETH